MTATTERVDLSSNVDRIALSTASARWLISRAAIQMGRRDFNRPTNSDRSVDLPIPDSPVMTIGRQGDSISVMKCIVKPR